MMTWFSLLMLPFARAAAVVTRPISIDTATDTLVLPDIDFLLCGSCDNRLAPTTRGNLVSRGRRQQRSSVTDFEWATSSETTRCCRLADVSTGMTTRRLVSFIDPLCPRPKESHVEGMPPKPVYNRLDRRETGLAYAQGTIRCRFNSFERRAASKSTARRVRRLLLWSDSCCSSRGASGFSSHIS